MSGGEREAPGLAARWKRWWRDRVERAPVVLRIKRRIRQWRGTEPRSRVEVRCRRVCHGGWWIHAEAVRPGDRVYSFGVGRDLGLERALAEEYGAKVFAFDPTPSSIRWLEDQSLPDGLQHVPLAVGGRDGHAELHEPISPNASHSLVRRRGQTGRSFRVPIRRLPSILQQLGHDRIHHLKLDVEGAEYPALRDLLAARIHVRQLLVEFHHRFASFGRHHTEEALAALNEAGYRIFHISPDGREYSFLRLDPATGTL